MIRAVPSLHRVPGEPEKGVASSSWEHGKGYLWEHDFFFFFLATSCGMWDLSSWLGIKPMLPQWKHGFLTTGWPRKSQGRGFWAKSWKAPLAVRKGCFRWKRKARAIESLLAWNQNEPLQGLGHEAQSRTQQGVGRAGEGCQPRPLKSWEVITNKVQIGWQQR